jgi:hypothetical protein
MYTTCLTIKMIVTTRVTTTIVLWEALETTAAAGKLRGRQSGYFLYVCYNVSVCTDAVRLSRNPFRHSGLAVRPPNKDGDDDEEGGERDSLFRMAQSASAQDSGQVKRTITMVRASSLSLLSRVCGLTLTECLLPFESLVP